jgi:succinyl-diaminopimelate desuccinylase
MDEIDILNDLIRINSANPFKTISDIGVGNETEIISYLEERLLESNFEVTRQLVQEESDNVPARYNLLAEKGSGDKSLLFFGHVDTVDVKDGWDTDPFTPTLKTVNGGKRIYGLGSNDMKAGLAAIVAATTEIVPVNYKIKVAFVVDEEFWSFGGAKLVESSFLDDVVGAIVPEIGESNNKTDNQKITLGRMGRTEYLFTILGQSDHGAKARDSEVAVNAVHESIKLQQEIIKYCQNCEQEFVHGDISLRNSAYISYQEGGKAILSIPEKASFVLDRSFVPGEDMNDEIYVLKDIINNAYDCGILDPHVKVTVEERNRPTPAAKPYFVNPENDFVKFVTEKVVETYGAYEYGIGYSVADENRLAEKGIPTIVLGPRGKGCHSANEWVDVESVRQLVECYRGILKKFR